MALTGMCGQLGYGFQGVFCLKQGINFINFCLFKWFRHILKFLKMSQKLDFSHFLILFVLTSVEFNTSVGKLKICVSNRN